MDRQELVGRRGLLMGAGAGLGALALASVPTAASAAPEEKGKGGLTGSWLVTVNFSVLSPPIFPPPPTSRAVYSFAAGGVFSIIVLSPAGPFPALGTWERSGDHTFKATVWQSISTPGAPTLAVRASLVGTFSAEQIDATATYDLFVVPNLPPKKPVASGTTTSSGPRIDA